MCILGAEGQAAAPTEILYHLSINLLLPATFKFRNSENLRNWTNVLNVHNCRWFSKIYCVSESDQRYSTAFSAYNHVFINYAPHPNYSPSPVPSLGHAQSHPVVWEIIDLSLSLGLLSGIFF